MNDIRLAGLSHLSLMRLISNLVCLFDHADIIGRVIGLHFLDQTSIELLRRIKVVRLYQLKILHPKQLFIRM